MLSPKEFAEARGIRHRLVQDLLAEGRIAGAVQLPNRYWKIPANATVLDEPMSAPDGRAVVRQASSEVAPPSGADVRLTYVPPTGQFWWTLDEVAELFAPHVTRSSVARMLRAGELVGYRRGGPTGRAWLVPTSELRRLLG